MNRLLLLAATLLAAACTRGLDNKIDGSSEQTFRASLGVIRESVTPEAMRQLDEALKILAISDVSIGFEGGILGAMEKMGGKTSESLAEGLLAQVNGKTGKEVIAAAEKRRTEQGGRQLATVNAEIAKLAKARADKEGAREFLTKISIVEPRIAITGGGGARMAIIDFKVQNASEEGISSVALRGTVTGAEGKVLLVDEFNYKSSTPIMPGQTREVRLPSSSPGKWNSPELARQTELQLQLQVENAATPSGSKLAASFGQKEADRLALLEKQKPVLEAMVAGK